MARPIRREGGRRHHGQGVDDHDRSVCCQDGSSCKGRDASYGARREQDPLSRQPVCVGRDRRGQQGRRQEPNQPDHADRYRATVREGHQANGHREGPLRREARSRTTASERCRTPLPRRPASTPMGVMFTYSLRRLLILLGARRFRGTLAPVARPETVRRIRGTTWVGTRRSPPWQ